MQRGIMGCPWAGSEPRLPCAVHERTPTSPKGHLGGGGWRHGSRGSQGSGIGSGVGAGSFRFDPPRRGGRPDLRLASLSLTSPPSTALWGGGRGRGGWGSRGLGRVWSRMPTCLACDSGRRACRQHAPEPVRACMFCACTQDGARVKGVGAGLARPRPGTQGPCGHPAGRGERAGGPLRAWGRRGEHARMRVALGGWGGFCLRDGQPERSDGSAQGQKCSPACLWGSGSRPPCMQLAGPTVRAC
jgi:hypothetical protein